MVDFVKDFVEDFDREHKDALCGLVVNVGRFLGEVQELDRADLKCLADSRELDSILRHQLINVFVQNLFIMNLLLSELIVNLMSIWLSHLYFEIIVVFSENTSLGVHKKSVEILDVGEMEGFGSSEESGLLVWVVYVRRACYFR